MHLGKIPKYEGFCIKGYRLKAAAFCFKTLKVLGALAFFAFVSEESLAVVSSSIDSIGYVTDRGELKASLDLDVVDRIEQVKIPLKKLAARIRKSGTDERVEAVEIKVPRDGRDLAELVVQISKPMSRVKLHKYLREELAKNNGKPNSNNINGTGTVRVKITSDQLAWFDLNGLSEILARPHHEVSIVGRSLMEDADARKELLRQVKPYLAKDERDQISQSIKRGEKISVEKNLLTPFAKEMVRTYSMYRGPNCFHAALAFQSTSIANSPYYNVKEEAGYHRSMINYDELWRALQASFYEVNPKTTKLEYGDVIVFFDVNEQHKPINFRNIRHAASYLFGDFTFSKGSKSPETPYTIKTLDEEWTTWRGYTKNLGVKIYRRSVNRVKKHPPKEVAEWLY